LASAVWLNSLYEADDRDVVDLNQALAYADRFRIRNPSRIPWHTHSPHIDGGSVERWEDPELRSSFAAILRGDWKHHDPFKITGKLKGNPDMFGRPNQASVFRSFQGWLAMSDTSPGEGTLRVFPDLLLSSAYVILRPFFRPVNKDVTGDAFFDASNWVFDTSDPVLPGIRKSADGKGFIGPNLSHYSHPHMRLETAIVSIPRVRPGDMAFWHCDVVHSVESYHNGPTDSSVMYIPAVPLTVQNVHYLAKQRDAFLQGKSAPDFPVCTPETDFVHKGLVEDIHAPGGLIAMGLAPFTVGPNATDGAKEAVRIANEVLVSPA